MDVHLVRTYYGLIDFTSNGAGYSKCTLRPCRLSLFPQEPVRRLLSSPKIIPCMPSACNLNYQSCYADHHKIAALIFLKSFSTACRHSIAATTASSSLARFASTSIQAFLCDFSDKPDPFASSSNELA